MDEKPAFVHVISHRKAFPQKILSVHLLLEPECLLLPFYPKICKFLLLSFALQFACNTLPIANQILLIF